MGQKEMAIMGKNWVMIYGPKTERILAGVLTVASGGFLSCWVIWGRWDGATSLACSCCSASASPRCLRERGGHDHAKNSLHFPRRYVEMDSALTSASTCLKILALRS
jgi:dolichol kinase